jgi:lycopene cyclase domain-containing protein
MDARYTYFALLLVWALPPIALQWIAGWPFLNRHRRAWLLAILLPTVWLVAADSTALGVVWTIAPGQSTGMFIGNIPVEEAVFFLLTNTLVVQSFLLLYHAGELKTYWQNKLGLDRLSTARPKNPAKG